jgi:sortase A
MKKSPKWGSMIIGITISVMVWQFTQGNLVSAEAWLAQRLLHTSWLRAQASGRKVEPWPWANAWPLARLSVPHLKLEEIVLNQAGDNGMSAFALGHSRSSVLPGELGNSVLNVHHRETFTKFLKQLRQGDTLVLESLGSGSWHYQVSAIYIVDKTDTYLVSPSLNRRLTLVSCYPCTIKDNRRYVVVAEEIERVGSLQRSRNVNLSYIPST